MIRSRARSVLLAVLLLALVVPVAANAAPTAPTQDPADDCGRRFPSYDRTAVAGAGTLLSNLGIRMSDGVVLRADVTLPTGLEGPFPVILTITGYGKSAIGSLASSLSGGGSLVSRGYATVMVDDRGTGSSGGTWDSWGPRTVADYSEVLDWIVDQPWSDGRVGLTGASYMGITSLYAAASGHPAVKAVFATVPMADSYRDIVLGGGQINTAFIPLWMGLVTALSVVADNRPETLLEHLVGVAQFQAPLLLQTAMGGAPSADGPFWRQRSPIEVVDDITAPTFIVGGLDDLFQRGEPMLYERLADHTDARLLLGPWTHAAVGSGLPRDGVPSMDALALQWFDEHVLDLDTGAACIPQVTQFVRGHGRDRYESAPSWPVPNLQAERWYLGGTGGLGREVPAADGRARQYQQLPITGICTRSAAQWLIGVMDPTLCARDNRIDDMLSLTYTSEPFATETYINGPIEADVWIQSSRPEALVSVGISSVAPDGTSRGLSNGLLMASHRAVDPARSRMLDGQSIQPWHPFTDDAKQAVVPGEPMLLPIEVFPTSAVIPPGHRLRVTVAPFDVPHALPPLPGALDALGGTVTVLSDASHPSSVVLPVVTQPVTAAGRRATSLAPSAPASGSDAASLPTGTGAVALGRPTAPGATALAHEALPAAAGRPSDFVPAALACVAALVLARRLRRRAG